MISQPATESSLDTYIPKRWLTLVRVIWLALVLVLITLPVVSIPAHFNVLRVPCAGEDCYVLALSPGEVDLLRDIGLSMEFYAGYWIGLGVFVNALYIALAGLIFWRRSDSWMGILVSLTFLLLATSDEIYPELYPNLRLPLAVLDSIFIVLFVLLFYLFPDGRFVPRWTSSIIIFLAGVALIVPFIPTDGSLGFSSTLMESVWGVLVFSSLIVGVFAQLYRYRRLSTPTQRQQTKWILLGLTVVVIALLGWALFADVFPLQPAPARLAYNFSAAILGILLTFLPISMAISILRYRLWDIDIVINRALVYGLLTGTLALVYFGSVVLLQSIVTAVGGQQTAVVTVISTLAIATLFNPLRHRIQDGIDRRFFRRKYDAQQVLAKFAARVRDEVDLERLAEALLTGVEETMEPTHMSLWLAEGGLSHVSPGE